MGLLLRAALRNRKHLKVLIVTVLAMVMLTLASQLEVFSFRVVAEKGVDFFDLFATEEVQKGVSLEEVQRQWGQAQDPDLQKITVDSANRYLIKNKKRNWISRAVVWLDDVFGLQGNIQKLAIFLILVAIIKAISLFAQRYTVRLVSIRVSCDLRQQYFQHLQTLPMSFYQQHEIGSLSARVVGDAQLVADAINGALINYIETPFKLITTLALCFLASTKLSILVFCGFPLLIYPIIFLARRVKRAAKKIQKSQEAFSTVILDFLMGIHTVKVFGMEKFSLSKYREQNEQMAYLDAKVARYDTSSRPIIHSLATLFLTASLLYGLYIENMDVPEVLFFCALLYVLYEPIKKFAEENIQIQKGVAAAERMYEVLDYKSDIQDSDGATELTGFSESLEFDGVWFRYGEDWIIKDLSFKIKKGETVAIVGPTGGGKSTITQLLPRLYDVSKGEIRIDGKPLHAYKRKSIRKNMSFVSQKPFLFIGTVEENIRFGQDFTQEQVEDAAKRAHADEFIKGLPEGYYTMLTDAGGNLSGGQQQRVAIARALMKDTPILIMDEATSALDAVSESHIRQTIRELKGDITQIVIAHRLSILEDVDRVIFIEDGYKTAEGTVKEVLAASPLFKQMYNLQMGSS